MDFEVRTRTGPAGLVVTPVGELDIATVERMRNAYVEREPGQALTLDLTCLEFMDTSGIQVIVEAYRAAREEGFDLSIIPAQPDIQRVFELAGLDRVLPFTPANGNG